MEKRVIIAVILCVGVLAAWTKLVPQPPAALPAASAPAPVAPAAGDSGSTAATPTAAVASQPEQDTVVVTKDVRFVFSTTGGTLRHANLLDAKFRARPNDPSSGRDLVTTDEPQNAAFRTTFAGATFPPLGGSWQVSQPAPDVVSFVNENADVRVEKRYRADTTRYRLYLDVIVQNKTAKSQDHALLVSVAGRQDPNKKGGSFFSGGASNLSSVLCGMEDKVEREPVEKLGKDPIDKTGTVRWFGTDEKFFLLAAAPYPEDAPRERTCKGSPIDPTLPSVGEATLRFQSRTVAAHASTSYRFVLFAGPKIISELEAVRPGGIEINLDQSVDVSTKLSWVTRPILYLLKFFYSYVHNWGVAIILLTLFIKMLTFYFTQKSLLSAKKMQKLAPKMNAIKKKYENDKQRQSVETMNLYKAHGVSPFGGCLPSLIQMPIWIALYSTLNYAVELYRAPFIFHIHDLTDKDPFYITPLLMGGVMFLQMRMSPASPDNDQQKTMQVMMPIMFTAFSLVLPAGLALYMLTSYLIGILQQLYVNYVDRKGSPATA
ncbi:MAG TPA: membrane protein insertase YidC [Polyangia bacterium]|nr:membrane protein insertase YidC [Polyangia bacterium]